MNKRASYATAGSAGSAMDFFGASTGLDNVADLMLVLEELQIEENTEHWNTLLDSKRLLLEAEEADIRMTTPSNKIKPCKLYYFNDMFIIGQYKKRPKKKANRKQRSTLYSQKTLDRDQEFMLGAVYGRKQSLGSDLDDQASANQTGTMKNSTISRRSLRTENESRRSINLVRAKLKLKLWMDMDHVEVKKVQETTPDEVEHFGIKCYCTIPIEEHDEETGEVNYLTEVQQVQFFFGDESQRDRVFENLVLAIDYMMEEKINGKFFEEDTMIPYGGERSGSVVSKVSEIPSAYTNDSDIQSGERMRNLLHTLRDRNKSRTMNRKESKKLSVMSSRSVGTVGSKGSGRTTGSKKRSFVKAKRTMHQMKSNRNKKKIGSLSKSEFKSLTLDDLEERYKVLSDNTELAATFSVIFGTGSMGFALSSLKATDGKNAVGVFVGKLEPGGMAETGGVTIGDKVIKIDDKPIDDSMSWQDCINLIKERRVGARKNRLVMVFARTARLEKLNQEKREEKLAEKKEVKEKENIRRKKQLPPPKSSIVKPEIVAGNRQENKESDEAVTKIFAEMLARPPMFKSKREKKNIYILQEIYTTEVLYLSSLYMMVDYYKTELSQAKARMPCKELPSVTHENVKLSKFCEHRTPRIMCSKVSASEMPIMTASETKKLFSNVELLIKVNEALLGSLQKGIIKAVSLAKQDGREVSVVDLMLVYAPVFSHVIPYFRMYSTYAYQYSNILEVLALMKERATFNNKLITLQAKKGTETLNSLLIKPISRLCKYPLLFNTLTKEMTPYLADITQEMLQANQDDNNSKMFTPAEIDKMNKCLDEMVNAESVVDLLGKSVDVKVGVSNDLNILWDIYHELGGAKELKEFLLPSRRFVSKHIVYIEDKSQNKKSKPYYLYLFNDQVIFAVDRTEGGISKFFQKKKRSVGRGHSVADLDQNSTNMSRFSASRSNASGGSSSNRKSANRDSARRLKFSLKVDKQIKIGLVNCRKIEPNSIGQWGIGFTEKERREKIIKAANPKKGTPAEIEYETFINRYDIFVESESTRDHVYNNINLQVKEHKKNQRDMKKAQAELKPEMFKRQRAWKHRARRTRGRRGMANLPNVSDKNVHVSLSRDNKQI